MNWNYFWLIPGVGLAGILGVFGFAYAWFIEVEFWLGYFESEQKEENVTAKGGAGIIVACLALAVVMQYNPELIATARNAFFTWAPVFAAYVVHRKITRTWNRGFWPRWFISIIPSIIASYLVILGETQLLGPWLSSEWLYGTMFAFGAITGHLLCIFVKRVFDMREEPDTEWVNILCYVTGGWNGLMLTNSYFANGHMNTYSFFTLAVQLFYGTAAVYALSYLANVGRPGAKL